MQTTLRRDEHGKVLPDIDQRVPLPKFYRKRLWAVVCPSCRGNVWTVESEDIRCTLCSRVHQGYFYVMNDEEAA